MTTPEWFCYFAILFGAIVIFRELYKEMKR